MQLNRPAKRMKTNPTSVSEFGTTFLGFIGADEEWEAIKEECRAKGGSVLTIAGIPKGLFTLFFLTPS